MNVNMYKIIININKYFIFNYYYYSILLVLIVIIIS